MKKRLIAAAMSALLLASALPVSADFVRVPANNTASALAHARVDTPLTTAEIFSGMSWDFYDKDFTVVLNVSDSDCGVDGLATLQATAAAMGATVETVVCPDLELLSGKGWSTRKYTTDQAIRVCYYLKNADATKEYGVISLNQLGGTKVYGDLDADPTTLTIDATTFDTYAIVSAPAGTFDAYKIANPSATVELPHLHYVKYFSSGSTIITEPKAYNVPDLGCMTPTDLMNGYCGGFSKLQMTDTTGPDAQAVLYASALAYGTSVVEYFDLQLLNAAGDRITSVPAPVRIQMSVPRDLPVNQVYAIASLKDDGTVEILPDIDANAGCITFDTTSFRAIAVLCTPSK